MTYNSNSYKRSKKNPTEKMRSVGVPDYGIYIGEVISTVDDSKSGRITVFIPNLGKDREDPAGYHDCFWSSPFAGSTDPTRIGNNIHTYNDTMKSYGLWAVPPDTGNLVLVAFGDGKKKMPVIIACLFPDQQAFMVPGNAAGVNYNSPKNLPVAEKNKKARPIDHTNNSARPVSVFTSEALVKQGLINDPIRGTTTSSARRESPSKVFGILTPGPRDSDEYYSRIGGHSFVMDDEESQRHIRLRTALGSQILMDDTNGIIYVINRDGTAWVELAEDGTIHIYSNENINMRARGNFNLRADQDINIEAGGDIRVRAGIEGENGDISLEAGSSITQLAYDDIRTKSTNGDISTLADGSIFQTTKNSYHLLADNELRLTGQGDVSLKSAGTMTSEAGGINYAIGSQVRLNSGGSAQAAEQGKQVEPFNLNAFEDQPQAQPGFEVPEDDSTVVLPTDGYRPGDKETIETITDVLLTLEPWFGHAKSVPVNDDTSRTLPNETVLQTLPAKAIRTVDQTPAASNEPGDTRIGTGYDSAGNPQYSSSARLAQANDFAPASAKRLAGSEQGLASVRNAATVETAVSSVTKNAAGESIIGYGHKLSPMELEKNMVAFRSGEIIPLDDPSIASVVDSISAGERDGVAGLVAPGTFVTTSGTKIVDLNTPIDARVSEAILGADMNNTARQVSRVLKDTPLSNNQFASLTSFARSIGVANFTGSRVVEALIQQRYEDVPFLMQEWSNGAIPRSSRSGYREDYKVRREYEAGLFSLPDIITPSLGSNARGLGYGALNQAVRRASDELVNSVLSGQL